MRKLQFCVKLGHITVSLNASDDSLQHCTHKHAIPIDPLNTQELAVLHGTIFNFEIGCIDGIDGVRLNNDLVSNTAGLDIRDAIIRVAKDRNGIIGKDNVKEKIESTQLPLQRTVI